MKRLLAVILILTLALPVCAKKHQNEEIITPQTQLEKRKFQTRTYKAKDQAAILKSILNVLQDDGYIVYNVNSLLGFIYAVKDFDTTDPNIDISKEFGFSKSRLNYNGVKVATLETCANVTQYGENIRVRINFKRKLLNEYGNAQFIDDVSEGEFYDAFYTKLDSALALHKDLNAPKIVPVSEPDSQPKTEKQTVITPDLVKEINDNIEKVINSDAQKIPEITVSQDQKVNEDKPKKEVKQEKELQPETASSKKEKVTEESKESKKEIKTEEKQKDEKVKEKKQTVEDSDSKKSEEAEKKMKKADKE